MSVIGFPCQEIASANSSLLQRFRMRLTPLFASLTNITFFTGLMQTVYFCLDVSIATLKIRLLVSLRLCPRPSPMSSSSLSLDGDCSRVNDVVFLFISSSPTPSFLYIREDDFSKLPSCPVSGRRTVWCAARRERLVVIGSWPRCVSFWQRSSGLMGLTSVWQQGS